MKRAAIGLRMHSGWGALVVISNEFALEVVDRRHIVIAQATIPGSKQPYHYAENLELEQAGAYIARRSGASGQLASAAIHEILSGLEKNECKAPRQLDIKAIDHQHGPYDPANLLRRSVPFGTGLKSAYTSQRAYGR
jgi:hypothetical protein